MNEKSLIQAALDARMSAWSIYSGFLVGAALLTKSKLVFTGCNIEFSSFSPTVCAERVALLKAVSEGEREFDGIVIVGGRANELKNSLSSFVAPCGVCRQSLSEFCDDSFRIILAKSLEETKIVTLGELFPMRFVFNPKNLHEKLVEPAVNAGI